jgi:hypothetical protein
MKRFVVSSMRNGMAGTLAIAMFLVAMNVASPAGAEVLNVVWRGQGYQPRVSYTGLGAAPDLAANTTWNNLDTGDSGNSQTITDLVYSDSSAATGISIQLNAVSSFTPGGSPTLALFNGQLNANSNASPVSIDVHGLTASPKYDLYLYSARAAFAPDPTDFTVNAVTQSLPGSANTSSFVLGDNYVKFLAQSPTGGTLNVTFGGGVWGGTFNAMQVVGVPEPGTMVFLVTGLLGLLVYAWRKRK